MSPTTMACPRCNSTGRIRPMPPLPAVECSRCGGSGRVPEACPMCGAEGTTRRRAQPFELRAYDVHGRGIGIRVQPTGVVATKCVDELNGCGAVLFDGDALVEIDTASQWLKNAAPSSYEALMKLLGRVRYCTAVDPTATKPG